MKAIRYVVPGSLLLCSAPGFAASTLAEASSINSGDTAWMLVATALVILMTVPGLALFYAGMVRKKNVLGTLAQSFAICGLATVLWAVIGYSLAFSEGSAFIGGFDRVMLDGLLYLKDSNQLSVHSLAPTIPEALFMMFQMSFAIITPALITGAFAERMKFSAMLLFTAAWSLAVYAPVAHWVWGPGGWLGSDGVLDFAGGTVVHINAGVAGLVTALMLGKRIGYGREAMPPHNLVLTLIGTGMLWVGWFGFNAGSALAADGRAAMAMMTTQVGAATGLLGWMAMEWLTRGKPSVLGIASGAVAGLVAITPAAGFVGLGGAIIIGLVSGAVCFWSATWLKHRLDYDDSLDAFGVHGVGGLLGALLTGPLAVQAIGGMEGSLLKQAMGAGVTMLYTAIVSFILLKLIDMTIGLRVDAESEREGLDLVLHGERVE